MPYKKQLEELSNLSRMFDAGLLQVRDAEILPLSFFSQSYDVLKQITTLLQSVEESQVERMKQQLHAHKEIWSEQLSVKPLLSDVPEIPKPVSTIADDSVPQIPDMVLDAVDTPIPESPDTIVAIENIPVPENTRQIHPDETVLLKEIIEKQVITDLKKAMSLNDRFRFQRELFSGNRELMDETVAFLSTLSSLNDVLSYVNSRFNWNWEEEVPADFRILLEKVYV